MGKVDLLRIVVNRRAPGVSGKLWSHNFYLLKVYLAPLYACNELSLFPFLYEDSSPQDNPAGESGGKKRVHPGIGNENFSYETNYAHCHNERHEPCIHLLIGKLQSDFFSEVIFD